MTSQDLPAAAVLLIVALVMTSLVGGSPTPLRQPRQQIRHSSLPPSSYNFRSSLQRMDAAHDWGTHHGRILNYEDSLNQLGLSSWGMDWSRKMLHHPDAVQPRHHVTSTSNSYANLPSPISEYSNLYKSSPTIMSSTSPLYYSSPMFTASRMPYPHPHDLVHQADRFEMGPSSSTSNGDKLSEFSRKLIRVRTTQNMEPSIPLQNEDEESVMLTTEEIPQEEGGTIIVRSSVGFEVVEPNSVAQREDLQSETDNRVRELSTSLTNVRFVNRNLVEDSKLPDIAGLQENLVTGSEISPPINEESSVGESVTDEVESDTFVIKDNSDNLEHIFLNDIFDVSQLVQENLIELNNRELESGNDTKYVDEGKSFSSQGNSPRKLIQIIADRESSVNEDSNHKTIFLTILNPQSRNKGTKLKGSSLAEIDFQTNNNDSQNLLSMPFHGLRKTHIPIVSQDNNLNSNIDFESDMDYEDDVVQEFEVIGKQIAAMNRIGDADISDYLEDVPAESGTQVDGLPVPTELSKIKSDSNANNTLPQSNNTQQTLNNQVGNVTESKNDQDKKGKDQSTSKSNSTKISQDLQYQTEARWSPTAKNKYKQMIPGYQQPPGANQFKSDQFQESTGKFHSSGSYQAEDLSGQNYGSKVTGSQEPTIPYQQKYPGWAEVIPYQYHNKDPVTGAYSFGYGDQYQWRQEERRPDGVTFGGYGWLDETGKHHVTRFIADARGYRVLDPGQQIDFNVIPVYPATPNPEDLSSGGLSVSYGENPTLNKEPFVTPRPLILEPVGINIPYQQHPSSATSSASSQYPLPAGSSNRPPYLQFTVNTPPPQTVIGSSGQYPSLPTTRLPYSQTLTGTSRPYQQASSKPNKISGTNPSSFTSALVGLGGNLSSQSFETIGSQIASFTSGQNVGQNGSLSPSSSFPVNPAIPPSVLNHLYQQVTNQYQQKPHHGVGGSTSLSGSYPGPSNLPLNPYSATVADTNRNYLPSYPAELIRPGSGISSADHGSGLPFVYRDPVIDEQPSSGNAIRVDEKDSDKQKPNEKGNSVATGRPAISYPLPDNERETNMTRIDQMSQIDEVIPFGGKPPQYIPDTSAHDHRPWTSSVIRVQKPPRSPSLDYAFLTDDDQESVDEETRVQTYDDISTFLLNLLQNQNGVSSSIRNVDAEREKILSSDLSEKGGSGNTQLSLMEQKYNSGNTKGKKEVSKEAEDLRSDKVDSNIDDVNKGNTGETVGDYLGTVKFRIPVLGALDGVQNYGDLQVIRNEPAKIANEKSEVEVIDYKTRDDLEIEDDDDKESSSNSKSENKLKEVSSDTKPKSPRPSRPPPPPPLNFFTELLRQLMMARSDSNFDGQMTH